MNVIKNWSSTLTIFYRLNFLDVLVFLAGALLPFAFAPYFLSFIAVIAPAMLLTSWLNVSPKKATWRGWLFGLGTFGVGVSWVYISIHVYGQAPTLVAGSITMLFIFYLALFPAIQGFLLASLFPINNNLKLLIVFPSSWVIFELLRTWLFGGFPWLLLGYTQTNTSLAYYAPIVGVYGISLLTAFLSGLIVLVVVNRHVWLKLFSISFVVTNLVFLVGSQLGHINWTRPTSHPIKVALIQGNIPQELKWQSQQITNNLNLYLKLTQQNWNSDLIIWPEAAVTLPLYEAKEFLNHLSGLAQHYKSTVITGLPVITDTSAYNSLIAIGNGNGLYHKRHLVPFGEYIPLKFVFNFLLQYLHIPMSNFSAGPKQQTNLITNGTPIAPYICYEVAYPLEFLVFLPEAQILLTVTDDSWFGKSMASAQHLQISQMRALETKRYLIFSSNTGITAIINNNGQIQKTVPSFQEQVLNDIVQPMEGTTPWIRWKIYPLMLLITFLLSIAWIKRNS